MTPTVKRLSSGYILIWWSNECWAQLPPGYCADRISGEHIFHPSWNSLRINAWWSEAQTAFVRFATWPDREVGPAPEEKP